MKTIKALINDELLSRASTRSVIRDEVIEDTYYNHPELERIDNELLALRGSRMLSIFDKKYEANSAIDVREMELRQERKAYILSHEINPDFDEEVSICSKCNDNGFITARNGRKVVCASCMNELLEECFEASGMSDYSSYKLNNLKLNYFDNKKAREKSFNAIKKLFEEGTEGKPLRIYYDLAQTGKTFLSVILTKYAIVEGNSAYYIKTEDLRNIDDSVKTDLKKCDMLIFDDYSPELTRNWYIASSLNMILEARSASDRPTVLVTSVPKEELVANSDARIALKIKRSDMV